MSRRLLVAVAIVMAALVASATPASAASGQLVVGASQSTGTELGSGTLTNMSVSGSGSSASIQLDAGESVISDFENGLGAWSGVSSSSTTTVKAYHGTHSLDAANQERIKRQMTYQGGNVSWRIYDNNTAGTGGEVRLYDGSTQLTNILIGYSGGGHVQYYDGSSFQKTGISVHQDEWTTITLTNIKLAAGTATVVVSNQTARLGSASINLETTGSTISKIEVKGHTAGYLDYVTQGGEPISAGSYLSAPMSVDNAQSAWANLTLSNATATTTWQHSTDGGSTWSNVTSATHTSSGNYSASLSGSGEWRVRVDINVTGSSPVANISDDGILFIDHAPSASNLDPPDGTKLSSKLTTLSADISDSEFPTPQGDNVTAEFEVKPAGASSFSMVGTDSRTSNGTVSTSYSPTDGGTYQWRVHTTDEYGKSSTSSAINFSVPDTITFRNESNGSQIITGATVTAIFYSAGGTVVIQKTDSNHDGNISLSGLPTTKQFVVTVDADGWYARRAYIASIYLQQDIFLLNQTANPDAVNTTFVYSDRTGEYPRNSTTLRIQRAIDVNNDGTYSWTTVAGDFWGAAGEFPFTGEHNARYRLIVANSKGDTRVVGTHIPTQSGTKNIVIGHITFASKKGTGRVFNASLDAKNSSILVLFDDPEGNTTNLRLRVWEAGNSSNVIYDNNFSGPYGTLVDTVPLTANQTDKSWVVNYTATNSGDGSITGQMPVGGHPFRLPGDPWLVGTLAWVGLTFLASMYGPRTATMGAWMLVFGAGALMLFQWVTIPPASLTVAALIATGGTVYREAIP